MDDANIELTDSEPIESSTDMFGEQTNTEGESNNYKVLARKYRPQNFNDLCGQEAMVQTLSNAFETGRIAQAWMLTGVRGVGKTTTARILARALNYELPGKVEKPSIKLEESGAHCQAIMEGRHIDVIEMDAASHTGINDIREITDAARYSPATARYKVYIIDEVHMLSNAAFNGLLKTLEEPPEHVKFIFATTEIRKVPVTVLSRCQRFDLRRIDAEVLVKLMRRISDAESVDISDEALLIIARAGEGSARDSLSLLDQAISHGAGHIDAEIVRSMLGLSDRSQIIDLFECIMNGNTADALENLSTQYKAGADPSIVISDLAEFVHLVTRIKIVPSSSESAAISEAERKRGLELSKNLSMRALSRAWQILLKGIPEVQTAPSPLTAADMVLVRLCYSASLPSPEETLQLIRKGEISASENGTKPQSGPQKSDSESQKPTDEKTDTAAQSTQTEPTDNQPAATTPEPAIESSNDSNSQSDSNSAQSSDSNEEDSKTETSDDAPPSAQASQQPAEDKSSSENENNLNSDSSDSQNNDIGTSESVENSNSAQTPTQTSDENTSTESENSTNTDSSDSGETADESVSSNETPSANQSDEQLIDNEPLEDVNARASSAIENQEDDSVFELKSFEDVADLVKKKMELKLKVIIESHLRPVSFEHGRIEVQISKMAPVDFAKNLGQKLTEWTGERWVIVPSDKEGGPTIKELRELEEKSKVDEAMKIPAVAEILNTWPGAEITNIKPLEPIEETIAPLPEEEEDLEEELL